MDHPDRPDRSPVVAELLDDAYVSPISVETAARHLWAIHKAAERLAAERALDEQAEDARWGADRHVRQPVSLAAGRRIPRAAVPLLVAVMVMSSSGMALAASQSSLPGDVLYPVKRGTETAQLIFTRNPEARAQLQLAFARARLEELRRIGQSRPQHVPALVSDITMSLTEVEQAAPEIAPASQALRAETTEQIAALELPVEITAAVDEVIAASASTTTAATTEAMTATEVPAPGGATETESPIVAGPLTSDPAVGLEPTASASPSPSPSSSPSATPTASPSASASASPSASPTSTAGGGGEQATGDGASAPAAEPTASETEAPAPGTIITPRPHPSGEGGESRTEDGAQDGSGDGSDAGAGGDTTAGTDDGSSEEPVVPFTRAE
jgi:hypothetical protein